MKLSSLIVYLVDSIFKQLQKHVKRAEIQKEKAKQSKQIVCKYVEQTGLPFFKGFVFNCPK